MYKTQNYDMIQKRLKVGWSAALRDKEIFEDLQLKKITIKECKNQFIKNNDFPENTSETMTDEYFRGWLQGLGYRV